MVSHRKGTARNQFSFTCLEDLIAPDNMVRVIDAFIDVLDFEQLGFAPIQTKKTGAPAYHPALLMRIYLYGYLNRIRSSRKLEAECVRNIEMQWLCESQTPCYHTIATFRTYKNDETKINHRKALKEVFRALNRFLNGEGLFGKETVATDGTKMRAQNAKKKNYTQDKLDKKIELSDANINKYLDELEQYDKLEELSEEQTLLQSDAKAKLEQLKKWDTKFKDLKIELTKRQEQDPEVTQISQTDPDARSIVINNSGHAEVAYNIVTAVDDKHYLIANYFTDNIKDTTLLAESLIAVKAEFDNDFDENLHKNNENTEGVDLTEKLDKNTYLNGLADKGFHAATQLQECADNNIITYCAVPEYAYSGKEKEFQIHNFKYNEQEDTFTCPNNQTLTTNGKLYDKKNRKGVVVTQYKRFNMSPKTCAECPFASKCLSKSAIKNRVSRQLERAVNQKAAEENKKRLQTIKGKLLYRKRQAIVEHPFGIIKRQWATDHTLLKGLEKVNAEFGIVCTAYNLRRAVSILSAKTIIEKLKAIKNNINPNQNHFFKTILRLHEKIVYSFQFFFNFALNQNLVPRVLT